MNETYSYVTNLQGDVTAILSQNGYVMVEYTYDAWGNLLTTTGSLANSLGRYNPLRYRGYVYDYETGLYYLQSRYYNPKTGRFLNADGFVTTWQGFVGNNMFAYCNNNPVMYIDPAGMCLVEIIAIIEAVIVIIEIVGETVEDSVVAYMKNDDSVLAVAQTIIGEAGGRFAYPDSWQLGQAAVAQTIINRYNSNKYPSDWVAIVTAKSQFTGYKHGKNQYEAGTQDAISWDYACTLASYMVLGWHKKVPCPDGFTALHMNFRTDNGQSFEEWGGIQRIAGNVFFYYKEDLG